MNKLFQQMNKIEAEITAGLRDGTDGPGAAPDNEPRQVRAVASSKPTSADAGSEEMAKLRQQLKKAEARLREKVRSDPVATATPAQPALGALSLNRHSVRLSFVATRTPRSRRSSRRARR